MAPEDRAEPRVEARSEASADPQGVVPAALRHDRRRHVAPPLDEAGRFGGSAVPHDAPVDTASPCSTDDVLRVALEALETEAQRLEEANAALIQANTRLESEVAARTAGLAQANAALRESQEHLRLVFESATDYAIYTLDLAGRVTSWNHGAERLLGWTEEDMLGRTTEALFTPEDRVKEGLPAVELRRVIEHGRAENERWQLRRNGSRFWASGLATPLRHEGGGLRGFLYILRDRTEARREEERRILLLRELDHRVKNTLAVVQSVAKQTERSTEAPGHFVETFAGRLMALARSHDILASRGWEGAWLQELIERTLAPHTLAPHPGAAAENGAPRLVLRGPPVLLSPNATVTVNLALHELVTNAARHGSLSVPEGHVEVTWDVSPDAQLDILWCESGGPPVQPPERRGFGSRLLERGLAREFRGTVRLDFLPSGLECRIRLALPPYMPPVGS